MEPEGNYQRAKYVQGPNVWHLQCYLKFGAEVKTQRLKATMLLCRRGRQQQREFNSYLKTFFCLKSKVVLKGKELRNCSLWRGKGAHQGFAQALASELESQKSNGRFNNLPLALTQGLRILDVRTGPREQPQILQQVVWLIR